MWPNEYQYRNFNMFSYFRWVNRRRKSVNIQNSNINGCAFKIFLSFNQKYKSRITTNSQAFIFPAGKYLLKVGNGNTRTRCEICVKLPIKTTGRFQSRRSGFFIVNFEHISHLVSSISIDNFEQVNAGWVVWYFEHPKKAEWFGFFRSIFQWSFFTYSVIQ